MRISFPPFSWNDAAFSLKLQRWDAPFGEEGQEWEGKKISCVKCSSQQGYQTSKF